MPVAEATTSYRFDKSYDDGQSRFRFTVDEAYLTIIRFHGKGNMDSAHAFIGMLDEALDVLGRDRKTTAIVDLSDLHGSPLRAQFILGKWLFKNKAIINGIAVFGAAPWETTLAKAIFKIAGMSRVTFCKTEPEARRWLGVP
jgi:hypothetical protein